VAERAAEAIRATAAGISIVAVWDGFSGGPSVEELRDVRPQLLLVAIGAHAQERWSYEIAAAAGVPAIVTCGGLFDFLAGDKRRAPAWMQRMGLEWLFRLALEPRRLISRYLLGNSDFLLRARAERVRARPSRDG
jgi:N-acetylglucosaminyldiphosphoundecaprenol N-acetyl-beta-D-mannosaminyltransferase